MNLAETVYLMVQKSMKAAQLTDLRVGTVTAAAPLEVTIDPAMPPIPGSILYLTEPVIEKRLTGFTGAVCTENGDPLPVNEEEKYVVLNRGLAAGDKVLLLRVQNGQKFIVLSRIFEEAT